jgi:hypothetical protein
MQPRGTDGATMGWMLVNERAETVEAMMRSGQAHFENNRPL